MVEVLGDVLQSETFWRVVAAAVAALVAMPWLKDRLQRIEEGRWGKLWRLSELAVTETYLAYVQELKRGREDGSLTDTEAREARNMALQRLRTLLREEMPEVLEHYSNEALTAVNQRVLAALKGEGGDDAQ